MTPKDVQNWLLSEGYRAQLDEVSDSESDILTGSGGYSFRIAFWRPEPLDGDVEKFDSFTFIAFSEVTEKARLEALNEANSENKFIKCHRDESTLFFEMDVPMNDEILTEAAFESAFGHWSAWLPDFVDSLT